MKKYILFIIAIAALASCTKQDNSTPDNSALSPDAQRLVGKWYLHEATMYSSSSTSSDTIDYKGYPSSFFIDFSPVFAGMNIQVPEYICFHATADMLQFADVRPPSMYNWKINSDSWSYVDSTHALTIGRNRTFYISIVDDSALVMTTEGMAGPTDSVYYHFSRNKE